MIECGYCPFPLDEKDAVTCDGHLMHRQCAMELEVSLVVIPGVNDEATERRAALREAKKTEARTRTR